MDQKKKECCKIKEYKKNVSFKKSIHNSKMDYYISKIEFYPPPYYIKICSKNLIERKDFLECIHFKESKLLYTYTQNIKFDQHEYRFKLSSKEDAIEMFNIKKNHPLLLGKKCKVYYEYNIPDYIKEKYVPNNHEVEMNSILKRKTNKYLA